MLPHQQRVADEKAELDARAEKLRAFIVSERYEALPAAERERLFRQSGIMLAYSGVLGERIAAFPPEAKRPERLTTDPTHSGLTHGTDSVPRPQADTYLVLSDEELAKGFVRPYRNKYKHTVCGGVTTMGDKLSATYARDPKFYGGTYCCICQMHKPVGEFKWEPDGAVVGS